LLTEAWPTVRGHAAAPPATAAPIVRFTNREMHMSDRFESDAMDDMLSDAGEGPAQSFDAGEDALQSWDAGDDEGDGFLDGVIAGRGGAQGADDFEEEGFEGFDEAEGFDELEAHGADQVDSLEDAVADALEEDDADEFMRNIRRLARRAIRTAGQVGRRVGQAARIAAPILTRIPLPQAQALGRIASVAGRLLADGADEFEAIDEIVDSYDDEMIDAAAPLIAGMAIRRLLPQAGRLPQQVRRQLVRNVAQATRTLVRRQGAPGARAAARIVGRAVRAVRQRQLPARAMPQAVRRAAQRVAQRPRAAQQLARPLSGNTGLRRPGYAYPGTGTGTRHLVLRGPGTITITIRR
jgi:hypothetical protein